MFVGKSSFDQPVTSSWSPNRKLIATASIGGGGFGLFSGQDTDVDFHSDIMLHAIDYSKPNLLVEQVRHSVKNQRFSSLHWGNFAVLAGGMTDGTVKLFQQDDLKELDFLIGSVTSTPIRAVQFHPRISSLLAHGGCNRELVVTDVNTRASVISLPGTSDVNTLAWNGALEEFSHVLASGRMDGSALVLDTRSKKAMCEIRDPRQSSVNRVGWSPENGYHLLVASDSSMRLFDLRSSQHTPMYEYPVSAFDFAWCPQDESLVVTCGKDNRMLLWDLFSSQVLCEMYVEEESHHVQHQHQMAPVTSNRRYSAEWSQTVPGLLSSCSFDASVQLFSLTNTLPRCPQWAQRNQGFSSFLGFGGRLVTMDPLDGTVSLSNALHTCDETMTSTISILKEFDTKLRQSVEGKENLDHVQFLCKEMENKEDNDAHKEVWRLLSVLCDADPLLAKQKYLIGATAADDSKNDKDDALCRALIRGDFETCVEQCGEMKRFDDMLFVASMAHPESTTPLQQRAQQLYREGKSDFSRLVQIMDKIFIPSPCTSPSSWKEDLTILLSFHQMDRVDPSFVQELDGQAKLVCFLFQGQHVDLISECLNRELLGREKDGLFCCVSMVLFHLFGVENCQQDRIMMHRFARLASTLAEVGEFELANTYATLASVADYEASDLVQRIAYGLVWNQENEKAEALRQAQEEEALRQEAEARHQAELAAAAALVAQQQQQQQYSYPAQQQQQQYAVHHAQSAPPPQQQYSSQYAQPQAYAPQQQQQPSYAPQQQQPVYVPPQQQQVYAPLPQQTYAPPPPQVYAPPPQQQQQTYVPPQQQQQVYAPPPQHQQQTYAPPPQHQQQVYAPPPQQQHVYAPPPQQQQQQHSTTYSQPLPYNTVPENDGFGTTAGNVSAGLKYGNYTSSSTTASLPQQAPSPQVHPVDPDVIHAIQLLQGTLSQLLAKYAQSNSMEERRLGEAEKGLRILLQHQQQLNSFFQAKLKELAHCIQQSDFRGAHDVQLTLSSSADWKEHKDWIKGLSHLIGVAQKDGSVRQ